MFYHILTYSADHDRRVAPFLRGRLAPVQLRRYTDLDGEPRDNHWSEAEFRYVFDGPLWYTSRERRIDLDFYPIYDGFLASNRLIGLLERHIPSGLRVHPVEMVHEDGQSNSTRKMSFCQIRDRRPACDLSCMDIGGAIHPELAGPNRIQTLRGRTVVACAQSIVLQPNLPRWFEATDVIPFGFLVDDGVRTECEKADLVGLRFVDLREVVIVDFMPSASSGYSLQGPQWRLRDDLNTWREINGPPIRDQFFDPSKPDPEIAALIANAKTAYGKL
jgi:hypothetical protein